MKNVVVTAVIVACLTFLASFYFIIPALKGPLEVGAYKLREMPSVMLAPEGPKRKDVAKDYNKKYTFREDWFSYNIDAWEKALEPFKGKKDLNYLEIGVYEGRSFFWMLSNILTDPSCKLVAIDLFADEKDSPHAGFEKIFRDNVKLCGAEDRIKVMKGFSRDEMRKLKPNSFDIIYIDGSHATGDVLEDAIRAFRLLKEDGIMIFDDYEWGLRENKEGVAEGPKLAIDVFYGIYGRELDVLHRGYQVFFRKRKATAQPHW